MSLTVLNVAFPFAQLTADPAGGAEQVLAHIDRTLVQAGHRSLVIAAEGSQIAGQLVPIQVDARARVAPSNVYPTLNETARKQTQEAVRLAVARICARESVDLVHLHGCDFFAYLPPEGVPALITLHMPLQWYPGGALNSGRRATWFNPVSKAQAAKAWPGLNLLPPIDNGVDVGAFPPREVRGEFALALGRICPEKGFHHAIEACLRAQVPLLLAGVIYPWPEHVSYFERQIAPRLDPARRWIGGISGTPKRRILSAARCVLIPSVVEETSSLVAMESLAAGTPVIAFRAGALPDIVEHRVTGYVVSTWEEMADALGMVDRIDRDVCRAVARRRFDLRHSMTSYLNLYHRIAASPRRVHTRPGHFDVIGADAVECGIEP